MLSKLVSELRCSIVHIVLVDDNKHRIGSGSGFLVDGYLITSNHVVAVPESVHYFIRIEDSNTGQMNQKLYRHADFMNFLEVGSDKDNYDYAIFNVPHLRSLVKKNLEFRDAKTVSIGDQIAFLGFPLEHENLTCHSGIISSIYKSGPANMFQIDASVNQSNSGGPLIDSNSGKVIGIITRKATGLTKQFDKLNEVYDQNIKLLEQSKAKGIMSISGFDPVGAFIAGQQQMKSLAREITRSANVGIGYAISIEHIASEPLFYDH